MVLFWESKGHFRPEVGEDGKYFSITIPPPNVTGELHMGHALQHTVHDVVIRWKRMQGFRTLCLPGRDHAGIGTQMKVEQHLYEDEKKSATTSGAVRWSSEFGAGRRGTAERFCASSGRWDAATTGPGNGYDGRRL